MPQNLQAESQDLFIPAHGVRSDRDLVTLLYEGDVYYGGQLRRCLLLETVPCLPKVAVNGAMP
jgi:hypothetical protein